MTDSASSPGYATNFDAARFAQELFVTSIASGATGAAVSSFIGSRSGYSEFVRPSLAKGTAVALATAVAESVHTALDRTDMNPLKGASMLLGPGLTGIAAVAVNRYRLVNVPNEDAMVSFAIGASSGIAGRYIGAIINGPYTQLPTN